jgi:two-component system LytT family response regulator
MDRVVIKSAGRIMFLRTDEIDWIEAADNYVRLHVGSESHLLRETLGSLEGRLDSAKFMRIHRSTVVNIDRMKELQPWFHGDYVVILQDGTRLNLSRTYRDRVIELLGEIF